MAAYAYIVGLRSNNGFRQVQLAPTIRTEGVYEPSETSMWIDLPEGIEIPSGVKKGDRVAFTLDSERVRFRECENQTTGNFYAGLFPTVASIRSVADRPAGVVDLWVEPAPKAKSSGRKAATKAASEIQQDLAE